jgi:site-specific DNA-methyltransferase (adenine-specific)
VSEPYYSDDLVTLYHGDCREVTAWLEADVLVTDPPYGVAWEQPAYLTAGKSKGQRTKRHDGIANDGDTSVRDVALSMWGDRPAAIFGAIDRPFPEGTRRVLVWLKPADAGLFGQSIWRKDWEPVFITGAWPKAPATESSVIRSGVGSHRQYAQGVHPHAKPTATLEAIIQHAPGTIADPFAGSGSTLVAAKLLGRRAIGVELEERYCEIAAKRLAQDTLFGGVA